MSKRDLAYVLVKLMGFSWLLLALFSSVGRIVELITVAPSNSALGAAVRGMSWSVALTPLVQIILALLIISKAAVIVEWLLGRDKT
jgi:hypothetical protein